MVETQSEVLAPGPAQLSHSHSRSCGLPAPTLLQGRALRTFSPNPQRNGVTEMELPVGQLQGHGPGGPGVCMAFLAGNRATP